MAHRDLTAVILTTLLLAPPAPAQSPLPGQVVIDPEHPHALKRHGGRHVFICGPGDPEDFLYRGKQNADGTRDGDQAALIRKLIDHGGNCLYLQIVRTHGGDAKDDRTHNPFVDSDPAKGLDEDILNQWDEWFTLADRHDILIYLFFYDDSARIWDTGDLVGPEERAFFETIVRRFKRHKNLIWVVGEESEERYTNARVRALAEVIRRADDHGHLVGNHHLSGTAFKAWQPGCALNHFAMQLTATGDKAHAGAVEALRRAAGRYQVIYSESTATPADTDGMRRHAWAVAMGGLMPMLLGMDIAGTPVEALKQCRYLQTFFESTDFSVMAPHDELAHAGTKYVLADPGRSYIAYADAPGRLGIKGSAAGRWTVTWLDCRTGRTVVMDHVLAGGDRAFDRPDAIGAEWAAWVRLPDGTPKKAAPPLKESGAAYFPPPESRGGWRKLDKPDDIRTLAGMDPDKLADLRQWLLDSDNRNFAALVIRNGYVVLEVERGNSSRTDTGNIKSCAKAVCATVLGIAAEESQRGRTPRKMTFDDPAFAFIPWADPLSDVRKAKITVKQLLNHTSGLAPEANGAKNQGPWKYVLGHTGDPLTAKLAFDPGTACGYSTHGLYHAALVCETVTGVPYDAFAVRALLRPIGVEKWWFESFDGAKTGRHPSHALGLPARDMARVAYCMLRGGRWDDAQVIPRWFVDETAAPTHDVKTPELRFRRNAQSFSHGWELPALLTGEGGRSGAGLPRDARYKPGSGGQLMAFVPSLGLVVTRQTGGSGQWEYEEYLRRACRAVLPFN